MEKKKPPCLVSLLLITSLVHTTIHVVVLAQTQQGFLNLACGMMPRESSFVDPYSTLTFVSDARFVDTGESGIIQDRDRGGVIRRGWYHRSFPQGTRNCYNLNVTQGAKYLVKAVFYRYHKPYEDMNFDLHIGPNKWNMIDIRGSGVTGVESQIIHMPTSDNLQVCLVKTGTSTPFISNLQLLPLNNDMYNVTAPNRSLGLRRRVFLSNGTKDYIRFPDDVHDRSWDRLISDDWKFLSTTLDINTSGIYQPPEIAMQTAATPKNVSAPLSVQLWLANPSERMCLFMYFSEVEALKPNETREFDIFLNGNKWSGPFSPRKSQTDTIQSTSPEEDCKDGECLIQLVRTSRSTHPPLLNALEMYAVADFTQPETHLKDVDAMERIKAVYGSNKIDWQGDPCSPIELLWDGLNCTSDNPPRITSLNLSFSGLIGIVLPEIQNLTLLEELNLSNNKLIGGVPEFLNAMGSLSVLDLSNNALNGSIPQALLDRVRNGTLRINVEGNPNLHCPSDVCKKHILQKKGGGHRFVVPVAASVGSLFVIGVIVLVCFLVYRKKSTRITGALGTTTTNKSLMGRKFSYSDIVKMTNNLEKVLGRGGFGVVYYGCLSENERVAVKILSEPSSLGLSQFRTEVELLLRVHHKNLLHLVGYCDEADKSALIYEYMANGDLKDMLSGNNHNGVLSFKNRIKIAAEASQGLEYLHYGCKPTMVHRDIKTSNILLDENLQAKIADFGLSKSFGSGSNTHTTTVVAGTAGYLDPEYHGTGWLNEKSDVYSFGVVLLEILTSQPVFSHNREGYHIVEWTQNMLAKGDIRNIVDPSLLEGDFQTNSVWRVLEVAMSCVNPSSSTRPSMRYVTTELNACLATETSKTSHGRQDLELNNDVVLNLSNEFTPTPR